MTFLRGMYLRPGNLWKCYRVFRKKTMIESGYPKETYEESQDPLYGVLAEAKDSESGHNKIMWDQREHSVTHTMVVRGQAHVKQGDMLTLDMRSWLVLYNDDVGALGMAGLLYLEERNDVK